MNDREEWRERVRDIRAASMIWWWWWWWYIYIYIMKQIRHKFTTFVDNKFAPMLLIWYSYDGENWQSPSAVVSVSTLFWRFSSFAHSPILNVLYLYIYRKIHYTHTHTHTHTYIYIYMYIYIHERSSRLFSSSFFDFGTCIANYLKEYSWSQGFFWSCTLAQVLD